jgi:tungstate transport system ATP-binding protein
LTAPLLQLRDVLVEAGGRAILDVPSLDARPSQVLAVVGPNGAGKSTLLRVFGLLEQPSRGEVLFDGDPVGGERLKYRRRMAVVFQEPLLLDMSVEGNVQTGLSLRGVTGREQKRRSDEWLERFGIAHLRGRSSRSLSGGEAQRTSLARAMVLEPEVLLLDEPFSSLDAPTRESLIDDLDAVLTERQVATVFVTHDRSEALRMGDRIAVLIGGRLRQVGSPNEVFSSPLDQEIAAFVGVENIIPGRVHSVADGLGAVEVAAGVIETATELEAGAEVLVCVRPEDVVLSREADAYPSLSARNHMRATVARVRSAGPYVRVEINAGFPLVALVTKQSREDLSLKPGSSVFATFKATAVHLIPHRRG